MVATSVIMLRQKQDGMDPEPQTGVWQMTFPLTNVMQSDLFQPTSLVIYVFCSALKDHPRYLQKL